MPESKETKEKAPRKTTRTAAKKPTEKKEASAPATPPAEPEKKPRKAPTRTRAAKAAAPKETPTPAAQAPAAPAQEAPQAAKNPAPRKAPKPHEPAPAAPQPAKQPTPEQPQANGFAAPETVGGHEPQGNPGHRKRRRRNRRGGDNSQPAAPIRNSRVDPDELVRRAWKIYLGEVTEEGLALMDDKIASEAARRSFRVAEIFLMESALHRPVQTPPPAPEKEEPAPPADQA